MGERKRHLTVGWCWRCDIDGEPAVWGIYGHVSDAEAREIVDAYEGEPVGGVVVDRDYRRNVPCRTHNCDCGGTHLEPASGPGRGASPYTWVEASRG